MAKLYVVVNSAVCDHLDMWAIRVYRELEKAERAKRTKVRPRVLQTKLSR